MQKEMHSKLVGVSIRQDGEDRQLNVRSVNDGQKLFWKHESNNPFDSNAIKVYSDENMTKPLGYIAKELAADLIRQGRNFGYKYDIYADKVTGGAGRTFGLNIRIVVIM